MRFIIKTFVSAGFVCFGFAVSASDTSDVRGLAALYQLNKECAFAGNTDFIKTATGKALSADARQTYDFLQAMAQSAEWIKGLDASDHNYVCEIVRGVFTVVEENSALVSE